MENQSVLTSDAPSPHDNVNLRHYWHVILERRWLVIAAFVSVFVLSLIYLAKAPRIYQAVARIQIDRESENVLNLKEALSFDGRETDYLQTQYKNLKSRTLIESIITQLHLDKDERYAKERDTYRAVDDDIQVVPIRLSRLVDVKVEHPNPKLAAQMANTLVRTFIDDNNDLKREESIEVSRFLEAEANTFTRKVEEADKRLQAYKEEKKSVSLEERQNVDFQALEQAQLSLSKAQAESAMAQTNALEVARLLESGSPLSSIPQVADDNVIKELNATGDARAKAFAASLTAR